MLSPNELTVANVSGMIAGAITLLQILIPLAIPLILLGLLQERNSSSTASAVSWSAVGAFLHASRWPTLLGADSAAIRGVPRNIVTITRLSTVIALLIGVAAIVTPLGLYETVVPAKQPISQDFHYIEDKTQFGYGTPPRVDLPWSRICGAFNWVTCPNSFTNITGNRNSTDDVYQVHSYDSHIPQYVIDAFQSGLAGMSKSVSSIFDIQSRSYGWSVVDDRPISIGIDGGTPYPIFAFQQVGSLILNDKYEAIEGLVVDTRNGGIGFRNHSAPPLQPFGTIWTEDLLFIEPESHCIDTNLTLDFMIPQYSSQSSAIANLVLTDHGGFVNIAQQYPTWDRDDPQNKPELAFRAYKAAVMHNFYIMAFMNVTSIHNDSIPDSHAFTYLDSYLGKEFSLMRNGTTANVILQGNSLTTTASYGGIISGLDVGMNDSVSVIDPNVTVQGYPPLYPNPWGIDDDLFGDIGFICSGAGGLDYANISNFKASCGLMFGAPRPKDNSSTTIFVPGTNWTTPLYSCISTSKATIKSVSFTFNGTDDLSGLVVTNVTNKVYPDEESKPLWGVEYTNLSLADVQPLWGLISGPDQGNISISTLRKESLYLPGYAGLVSDIGVAAFDNTPGNQFYVAALQTVFSIGDALGNSFLDYSGETNSAMFRRWQELSRTPSEASRILDLVWTDIAANSVVGTRGVHHASTGTGLLSQRDQTLSKRDVGDEQPPSQSCVVYHRRIRFHLPYGIPAFLALFATFVVFCSTVTVLIFGHSGLAKMRSFLNRTSQGRIMTSLSHNNGFSAPKNAPIVLTGQKTRPWIMTEGGRMITLHLEKPQIGFETDTGYMMQSDPLLEQSHQLGLNQAQYQHPPPGQQHYYQELPPMQHVVYPKTQGTG